MTPTAFSLVSKADHFHVPALVGGDRSVTHPAGTVICDYVTLEALGRHSPARFLDLEEYVDVTGRTRHEPVDFRLVPLSHSAPPPDLLEGLRQEPLAEDPADALLEKVVTRPTNGAEPAEAVAVKAE